MGFNLKRFGKLAGSVVRAAQGVADHLGHSAVAPPAPIVLGVAAVCLGAAAVQHVKRIKPRKQQPTPKPEV